MIKIEVTGNSIAEVADKLLAIGANLKGSAIVEGARAAVNAMKVMQPAPVDPVMPEVAEAAPVDPTPVPKSAPIAEVTESQPTTPEVSSAPAASASEPTGAVDFNNDVTPRVVKVVAQCGKPAMAAILEQFGVAKASHLDPEQLPELIAAMDDAIAGAA